MRSIVCSCPEPLSDRYLEQVDHVVAAAAAVDVVLPDVLMPEMAGCETEQMSRA
jgi:hypothetical protein